MISYRQKKAYFRYAKHRCKQLRSLRPITFYAHSMYSVSQSDQRRFTIANPWLLRVKPDQLEMLKALAGKK